MNLYQQILERAQPQLDRPALHLADGSQWSHRQLHETIGRCAQVLTDAGVEPGDRVTAQVHKSAMNVALYLATLRVGGVFMPLNTAYTGTELEYFLDDAQPRVLVCDPDRQPTLAPLAEAAGVGRLLTLDAQGQGSLSVALDAVADASAPVVARDDDDLAAILYTSGTTGRSKGAMLTHGNLLSNARTLRQLWEWQPDDVLLHALPIYHVHGLFVALHCALLEPSPVLLLPRFDVDAVLEALPRATVFMGVPTHYGRLLADARFNAERCRDMRVFISGSAPLLPETFAAFEARTGQRILERYGMSETGMLTSNPLHGERIEGTVGYPLSDVKVRVRTPEGKPCAVGEVGVLQVRGPNVFAGYWRQPERTAAEFDDGWFITGDLVEQAPDGRISIVGRHKDLIISGGLNVYPREIEDALNDHPAVHESAVIGVPHADFGEGIVALVVASDDWPGQDAMIRWLRGQLAAFKVPRHIHRVTELPRNAMGKVQKNQLRETYRDSFA